MEATDAVYRRWLPQLADLYRARVNFADVGAHHLWTLADWTWFLEKHGLLGGVGGGGGDDGGAGGEGGGGGGGGDRLNRATANACFYLGKFEVFDTMKDATRYRAHFEPTVVAV